MSDHLTLLVAVLVLATTGVHAAPDNACTGGSGADLRFTIAEGQSANHFIRQRAVSAHLVLQVAPTPRLIVAFPAGNSGASLYLRDAGDGPFWGAVEEFSVIARSDDTGRTLCGIRADIEIEADSVSLGEADVGSVRFLRKAVDYSTLPTREDPNVQILDKTVQFTRVRADGQSTYLLEVEVLQGELDTNDGLTLVPDNDGRLRIRIVAASGDPIEMPVGVERLLNERAGSNKVLRNALAFLTYNSKMLAGSWRFLTYFGRDTLLTLQLLMPVLTPEAAEIGLGAVFERVSDHGEVAHEEEIGELAVYRNMIASGRASADPVYDYDMVDDNLLLAPVLGRYTRTFGAERASRFLSAYTSRKEPLRVRLARNLQLVVEQASAFADDPVASNLVAIKDGLNDGNWRDSEEGLVGGRYPYDVNAVLMPAALRAAAELVGNGLLDDHTELLPGQAELVRMADVWEANAATFFRVSIAAEDARDRLVAYAYDNHYPLTGLPDDGVTFYAVALDAALEPMPVMHSDVGMNLLFLQRPEAQLAEIFEVLSRPFPAGLATPVGLLSANPAFADLETQSLVTRNHYHGTVVWSWQQAMIIAGIDAQLGRDDLSAAFREKLRMARERTWQAVEVGNEVMSSELWSFDVRGNEFVIAPFGQSEGHLTESNAVQLWSTVFLALRQGIEGASQTITTGPPVHRGR